MKAVRVVADSSILIGLAEINQLDLLRTLFPEILVPEAVYDEVAVRGKGETGSEETALAVKEGWISKRTIQDKVAVSALTTTLGQGESEAIVLCKESAADYVLIDEKTARTMAELMDLSTLGVLGIMDLAAEKGIPIDKKALVDRLIDAGFRISNKLYKKMFPPKNLS